MNKVTHSLTACTHSSRARHIRLLPYQWHFRAETLAEIAAERQIRGERETDISLEILILYVSSMTYCSGRGRPGVSELKSA